MHRDEIQPGDLCRYALQLRAVVEAICKSKPFRTSAKSCQFLRHIVQRALEGNFGDLKERLIGIALLGRETTYDTGSDAGVRVRANDVRKRLTAYYSTNSTDTEFTLEIPAGSYVPRFYLPYESRSSEPVTEVACIPETHKNSKPLPHAPELSLQQLALPTLVALFLCIICIRWQVTREHPFLTFWTAVFQDHHALLYVPPSPDGTQQDVISSGRFEDAARLFNLSGQFHSGISVIRSLDRPDGGNDILILIGSVPALAHDLPDGHGALQESTSTESSRLVIERSPSGSRIVDHGLKDPRVDAYGRAGLLTISNGAQHTIHIDGTDDGAIDSLIRSLSQPEGFPAELIDSFQQGTVTQMVIPMGPGRQADVFHESAPLTPMAMNGPR